MLLNGTMKRMHPFDMVAFDGDGHSTPMLEAHVKATMRAQWQTLNAAVLPVLPSR